MKKISIFAATACILLVAVSCQNDELAPVDKTVFTGIIENTTTRTTIGAGSSDDKRKVSWESEDWVNINNIEYKATPDENDASIATFTTVVAESLESPYTAIYPTSCYYDGEKYTLPSSYDSYTAGSFNHIPMYAHNDTTKELRFKNIFAVVEVTVSEAVTKVVVSSDVNLNGYFTVSGDAATISDDDYASTTTTLNCGSGITGDIYIPVPAGTYTGKNLRVTITKSDETTETMSTKQTATIQLNANEIIAFTFTKNSFNLISTTTKSTLL